MASEARTFLESVFAGKPENLYALIWTRQEKQSYWFQAAEDAIRFVESQFGKDWYIGVGFSERDRGGVHRCVAQEIAGIVGLWVDIDLKSDAHAKSALPMTAEEATQILPAGLPPTFLIRTGNGVHAWWLFKEPLVFENDEERQEAATLSCRWQTLLQLNASARGWALDRLGDLSRLLRIPGTQNCKDPQNPKPVQILAQSDHYYNPSELAHFLDDQGVPDSEEQERAAREWKDKFADKPLVLNPNATLAEDLLNRFTAANPRFKTTWLRERQDLRDSSQSGYDLALANFGFGAGLTEQQVVDMIIHHRRIHRQRPRNQLEYFQRTISKAFRQHENSPDVTSFEAPGQESSQAPSQPKPDSPTARALLCEQISKALGIRILRIVKIGGQEPTYRLELETTKIAFSNVDKLVGQHRFRMIIASAVEYFIPRIPSKTWDRIAQMMLAALTVEDGGDEADLVGSAKMYVDRYLSEADFIDPEEGQPYQTRSKPIMYDGQIALCSSDLQQHMNKAGGENRAVKEVTAMLSALGAFSQRLKRTKLRDQSRWLLPVDKFPPGAYAGSFAEEADATSPRR